MTEKALWSSESASNVRCTVECHPFSFYVVTASPESHVSNNYFFFLKYSCIIQVYLIFKQTERSTFGNSKVSVLFSSFIAFLCVPSFQLVQQANSCRYLYEKKKNLWPERLFAPFGNEMCMRNWPSLKCKFVWPWLTRRRSGFHIMFTSCWHFKTENGRQFWYLGYEFCSNSLLFQGTSMAAKLSISTKRSLSTRKRVFGLVSRKSRKHFGPKKPFVKLRPETSLFCKAGVFICCKGNKN